MALSEERFNAFHEQYVELTRKFVKIVKDGGATWQQAQAIIKIENTEEDVINPVYKDYLKQEKKE